MIQHDKSNLKTYVFKCGDKVNTKECAKFKNADLWRRGYNTSGDAWNPKNTNLIYSGYEGLTKPDSYIKEEVVEYNNKASDNFFRDFDSKTLDTTREYDVNMYYIDSPYQEQAYHEGKGVTGTHTGTVKYKEGVDGKPGQWEIIHNVNGRIHVDPFTKTQGRGREWGVTAIYEPEYATPINKFTKGVKRFIDPKMFKLEVLRNGGSLRFMAALIKKYE